jgi:signal transduction histidine kinase
MLVILVACGWDAAVTFYCEIATSEIKGVPTTVAALPRLWQLLQVSLSLIAPGVLAAWLASQGYPTSLRTCIRAIVAFACGSAMGHWMSFPLPISASNARPVWQAYADNLMTTTLAAAACVGAMYWWRRETVVRRELHRTRMGLLELRADCADAELLRLRTQIEPHFLFNTMATIVHMYRTDRGAARRTLARLIDYMSAARVHMQRQEAVLDEELALTEGYLEIQRLRMGARLRYEIEVSPEVRGSRIPPAALLTLVENAIKHGLAPRPGGGLLRVAAHRDGVWVALYVSDSGVGFRATRGRGLGLANLRARIVGLYGADASLRLTGAEEGGVKATMRLPFGPPPAGVVA